MNTPGSLFLTGPMGAGKSTIGRQLAKQLGMPFHDSDHEVELRTGVDISLIFELEGEAELIGENPFPLIGGQAALFVKARHQTGKVIIRAHAPELPSASIFLEIIPA